MKTKSCFLIVILFVSLFSYAQQLTYKVGGRVFDSNNIKLSHSKVRELLGKQPELLKNYNCGISKQNTGNLLLATGTGFILADLTGGLYDNSTFPTAFSYIGYATLLIAIPVKMGYSKKIKSAVEGYNKENPNKTNAIKEFNVISNKNGIGVAIKF